MSDYANHLTREARPGGVPGFHLFLHKSAVCCLGFALACIVAVSPVLSQPAETFDPLDWNAEISTLVDRFLSPPNGVTADYIASLDRQIDLAEGHEKLELLFVRSIYVNPVFHGENSPAFRRQIEEAAAQVNDADSYLLAAMFGAFVDATQGEAGLALEQLVNLIRQAQRNDKPGIAAVGHAYEAQIQAFNMKNREALAAAREALGYISRAEGGGWKELLVYEAILMASGISRDANLALNSAESVLRVTRELGLPHDQFRNGVFLYLAFSHLQPDRVLRSFARQVLNSASGSFHEGQAPQKLIMSELARLEITLGNYEEAYGLAKRAVTDISGSPRHDWWAEINLARAAAYTGRRGEAEAALARAEAMLEDMQSVGVVSQDIQWVMWEARSSLMETAGDFEGAFAAFREFYRGQQERWRGLYQNDLNTIRATLLADLDHQKMENQLVLARLEAREREVLTFTIIAGMLLAGLIMLVVFTRRLQRSEAQANAASHAKSRLLANVSHELRTPLNAILGFSEIMHQKTFGALNNEKYESYVGAIHNSGQHLLSVIEELLDISRIEAGKLDLDESVFSVRDLVAQTVNMLQPQARSSGVSCHCILGDEDVLVQADAKLIRQSLINLVNNALKFTPAGGRVEVTVEENSNGELEISVTDTGIGMSERDIKIAVQPFGQVQSIMSRNHQGSGLGLPIVDGFMKAHGGRLDITSEEGQGTITRMVLPRSRLRDEPALAPGHIRAAVS